MPVISFANAKGGAGKTTAALLLATEVAARGKRVAPNSIYRILDVFVSNGLAVRIESSNAYLVNSHPGHTHDCIFLVCEECGDAAHVDDVEVSRSVRALIGSRQFQSDHPVLEIRGLCRQCA